MAANTTLIKEFLTTSQKFAVVGASGDRAKFGNKVLRWYIDNGYSVVPVNPKEKTLESLDCAANLSSLPGKVSDYHVSIITPPKVTLSILKEAHENGISHVWLQPDVDSPEALAFAREANMQILSGGPCVLVSGFPSATNGSAKL